MKNEQKIPKKNNNVVIGEFYQKRNGELISVIKDAINQYAGQEYIDYISVIGALEKVKSDYLKEITPIYADGIVYD